MEIMETAVHMSNITFQVAAHHPIVNRNKFKPAAFLNENWA